MDISIILIIVVLAVYLVWKLMGTRNRKKDEPRRFSIRKHRRKGMDDEEVDE
jgi:flagellar biogenesis protein FliO